MSPYRGLAEIALEARDLDAMLAFYEEVIGLSVQARDEDRIWLDAGSARIGLWLPGAKEFDDHGGRHVHFALEPVDGEMRRVVARAAERGVEVRGPVVHTGGDRSVYLRDPAGNVVEVWDQRQPEEGPA